MSACPALLDRKMDTIHEQPQSLCEYQGKVLLVVLGFPSNDFGGQEPGSNKEISSFCVNQYAVDFPVFAKTALENNSFYANLAKATGKAPQWNFHKYLVDRAGNQVLSFDTRVEPDDPRLVGAIEKLLQTR